MTSPIETLLVPVEDKTKGIIWADEKITINDKDCCIDDVIEIFKNKKEGEC